MTKVDFGFKKQNDGSVSKIRCQVWSLKQFRSLKLFVVVFSPEDTKIHRQAGGVAGGMAGLTYQCFRISAVKRHLVVIPYLLAATPKTYCRLPPCMFLFHSWVDVVEQFSSESSLLEEATDYLDKVCIFISTGKIWLLASPLGVPNIPA